MQDLKVAYIQSPLHWEDKEANLKHFASIINSISTKPDLIVLPEMFSTGFSMKPQEFAEPEMADTHRWMKGIAKKSGSVICGSYIVMSEGKFYNRLLWMQADGQFEVYDKRHLFSMAGEDKHYAAGAKKLITTLKDWRICPMVCYDLRFPVWIRNTENYDCLIFIANWPEKRIAHWNSLLAARSIENQVFTIGVNRIGDDGNGIAHNGDSQIIGPKGDVISHAKSKSGVFIANLKYDELIKTRRHMPFLKDMDEFELKVES